MTTEQLDEKAIFDVARRIESPEALSAYLKQVCSDDHALRQRIENMVRAGRENSHFLESPPPAAIAPTLDTAPIAEKPGMMIGRYKLVHEIGHGGMGVVYMAVQKEPVKRKVALKIIKPGMDTKDVVARFNAERQALAMMDHQCIAHVLDGGSTESGRPYFVMELVDGTPITKYCDECRFTTRQRLELFVQVCQAVQHAHLKGIIHRDIKPSNILVTHYDGSPVPKVIDFGIAKAVHQPLTDASVYTQVSQMVGTPLYMSPEQAERTGQDVDTRTDVYSLGVLLYQLLTGTTPFDKARFQKSGLDEVKRIIREEEPPKPSTRLSTVNVALDTLAETHRTDLRTLTHELSGELDWIVMKALEKDRNRRYESASALSKDVQRYLDDEPVEACPPTTAYRLGKFYRRNKVALAFGAAIALTLFIGAAVATTQAVRALAAEGEAKEQKELAEQRLTQTDEQRQRAQANYTKAREAVKQMLTRVADEELAAIPEMTEVRTQLMQDARRFYDELIKLNPDDAQAYFERALVREALAEPNEEIIADHEMAIELAPENAHFERMYSFFLRWHLEDLSGALRHAKRAVELAPNGAEYVNWLAKIHCDLGEYDKALALHAEVVAFAPNSADAYASRSSTFAVMGNLADALADARQAVDLEPTQRSGWSALSDILVTMEKYDEALVAIDRAIGIVGEKRQSSWLYERRGNIHMKLGNTSLAIENFNRAIELGANHVNAYDALANLYKEQGNTSLAIENFNRAIELRAREYMYDARADLYKEQGRLEDALADWTASIQCAPKRWHILKQRGWLLFELGRYDEALADLAKAIELRPADLTNLTWISPSQVAACPDEPFRAGLLKLAEKSIELNHKAARAYAARGWILAALGQEEQALADLKAAFAGLPITDETGELGLSQTCYELANLCIELSHRKEVRPYLKRLIELRPEEPSAWYGCALAQLASSQTEDYRATCGRMVEQFRDAPSLENSYWTAWTCSLAADAVGDYLPVVQQIEQSVKADAASQKRVVVLGAILYRAGQTEKAIERLTEADTMMEAPESTSRTSPAYTWCFLAMAHYKLGHKTEAQEWLHKATEWMDRVVAEHDAGTATLPMNRRLTLKLLGDEAKQLLGPPDQLNENTEPEQEE